MHNLVGHQLSQYQHELEDKSPDPSANIALITPKKKSRLISKFLTDITFTVKESTISNA